MDELDEMYVVLKINDLLIAFNDYDLKKFNDLIDLVDKYREQNGKPQRKYVVVSDSLDCYKKVYDIVLEELNEKAAN